MTTRDKATYWPTIAIFPTLRAFDGGGGGSRRNIAITFGLVRNGSTEYTNVTDGRTDTA